MAKITKNMKISEIENYPKAVEKLAEKGMFCLGCGLATNETLEQGARIHKLNPDELVKELNESLEENKHDLKQLLKDSGYSEIAIRYYFEKTHIGKIKNPDAEIIHMGMCGDVMHFSLRIKNNIIENIKFEATCCVGGLSAGSAVSMLVKGKTIKQAKSLTEEDIARHLKAFPKQKIHCVCLALKALKKAIEN